MKNNVIRNCVFWGIIVAFPFLYIGAVVIESTGMTVASLGVLGVMAVVASFVY